MQIQKGEMHKTGKIKSHQSKRTKWKTIVIFLSWYRQFSKKKWIKPFVYLA